MVSETPNCCCCHWKTSAIFAGCIDLLITALLLASVIFNFVAEYEKTAFTSIVILGTAFIEFVV